MWYNVSMQTLKKVLALTFVVCLLNTTQIVFSETVKNDRTEKIEHEQKFINLSRNSFGRNVVVLQKNLKTLGYYDGFVSGIFGPRTEDGVKKFESGLKLKKTGIVNNDLYKKINSALLEIKIKKIKKVEVENEKNILSHGEIIGLFSDNLKKETCDEISKKDTSCIFDNATQKLTCDVFKEGGLVSLVDNPNKKKNLYINVNDIEGVDSVIFTIEYSSAPKEWSLNIGNSPENNGWGGSYTLNTKNAEIQIFKNIISVFRNDEGYDFFNLIEKTDTPRHIFSREIPSVFTKGIATFTLKENTLSVLVKDEKGEEVLSEIIQDDYLISMKSSLYASINRTISDDTKSGSGAKNISIELYDQAGNVIGTFNNNCAQKVE